MKSHRKELWFNVPGRSALINITPQVDECLRESGIQEGLCLVNAMHLRRQCRCPPKAPGDGLRSSSGDQRPSRLWHVEADLLRPGGMAGW